MERPCVVCHKPCRSEGQLCPACVQAGHYVTDTEVVVNLHIDLPANLTTEEVRDD